MNTIDQTTAHGAMRAAALRVLMRSREQALQTLEQAQERKQAA